MDYIFVRTIWPTYDQSKPPSYFDHLGPLAPIEIMIIWEGQPKYIHWFYKLQWLYLVLNVRSSHIPFAKYVKSLTQICGICPDLKGYEDLDLTFNSRVTKQGLNTAHGPKMGPKFSSMWVRFSTVKIQSLIGNYTWTVFLMAGSPFTSLLKDVLRVTNSAMCPKSQPACEV